MNALDRATMRGALLAAPPRSLGFDSVYDLLYIECLGRRHAAAFERSENSRGAEPEYSRANKIMDNCVETAKRLAAKHNWRIQWPGLYPSVQTADGYTLTNIRRQP